MLKAPTATYKTIGGLYTVEGADLNWSRVPQNQKKFLKLCQIGGLHEKNFAINGILFGEMNPR